MNGRLFGGKKLDGETQEGEADRHGPGLPELLLRTGSLRGFTCDGTAGVKY